MWGRRGWQERKSWHLHIRAACLHFGTYKLHSCSVNTPLVKQDNNILYKSLQKTAFHAGTKLLHWQVFLPAWWHLELSRLYIFAATQGEPREKSARRTGALKSRFKWRVQTKPFRKCLLKAFLSKSWLKSSSTAFSCRSFSRNCKSNSLNL